MSGYHYRITVDRLESAHPESTSEEGLHSLSFFAENHDDILAIVDKVSARHAYNANTAASLAVGLKLFSQVMVQHHHDPLFAPLREPMRAFIRQLKEPEQIDAWDNSDSVHSSS